MNAKILETIGARMLELSMHILRFLRSAVLIQQCGIPTVKPITLKTHLTPTFLSTNFVLINTVLYAKIIQIGTFIKKL